MEVEVAAQIESGVGGNANGNKTITFADGATVNVLLGSRKVHALEKIVDWTAALPANYEGLRFYGVRNGARIKLKATKGGVVRQIRWQKIGKRVKLTAISNRGYRFLGWYDKKGKRVSTSASKFKLKITKSTTYTAKFKKE